MPQFHLETNRAEYLSAHIELILLWLLPQHLLANHNVMLSAPFPEEKALRSAVAFLQATLQISDWFFIFVSLHPCDGLSGKRCFLDTYKNATFTAMLRKVLGFLFRNLQKSCEHALLA